MSEEKIRGREMQQRYSSEIRELISMSEHTLQAEIVEPLLRALGYQNVRDTSGPGERGKDLIAIKRDDFGRQKLFSIQIKRYKVSAKASNSQSLGGLLNQLRQAIEEPVFDPDTKSMRIPDGCVFITPYPVSMSAFDAFRTRLQDPIIRNVEIVDGPRLIDLIAAHNPRALARFSLESQYRLRIAAQANTVVESTVAFELRRPLQLDRIYIDATVDPGREQIDILSRTDSVGRVKLSLSETREYCDCYKMWMGTKPFETIRRIKIAETRLRMKINEINAKCQKELTEALQTNKKYGSQEDPRKIELKYERLRAKARRDSKLSINLDPFIDEVKKQIVSFLEKIQEIHDPRTSEERCTMIAREGIVLQQKVKSLLTVGLIKKYWKEANKQGAAFDKNISFSSSSLLKIKENLYLLGGPGLGKTTMLRWFARCMAESAQKSIPLYVPLITVGKASYGGLLEACAKEVFGNAYSSTGSIVDRRWIVSRINKGVFRLFLDGLDETGDRAAEMMAAIRKFVEKHRQCKIILSSRDTFKYPQWEQAFNVRLEAFTDKQLTDFIANWFSSEPSARAGLNSWLEANSNMRSAARTPIIAALLCSLYQIGAEMPSTETELYSRRFELLLGRWEQAKQIVPMPLSLRHRYKRFLMALAIHLHVSGRRSAKNDETINLAQKYWSRNIHPNPQAFIEDCVRRGLLERESTGDLSFGHLTYQEFMTAEWLCEYNPVDYIWGRLLSPWWDKTLEFYAARKVDIGQLILVGLKYRGESESMERIVRLTGFAPLTSPKLIEKIRKQPRTEDLERFRRYGRPPSLEIH